MEHRPPKRKRQSDDPAYQSLQGLLHLGGVSTQGLASILRKIREHGLPDVASRWQLGSANLALFEDVKHVEHMILDDGSEIDWELAHLSRLVALMVSRCPKLAELYKQATMKHPCSERDPWNIIRGFDEFVPGSKLKPHNSRKCMNLHFNFAEIGANFLWLDYTWFTPVCLRHNIIEKVPGGWSSLLRRFLKLLLLSELGMATAGLPLDLGGAEPFILWARVSFVLADGDGFRMAWEWNGANGLRPCLLHKNVLKLNSNLAHRDPNYVEISCSDHRLFQVTTTAEFLENVDMVLAAGQLHMEGRITGRQLNDIRMSTGLKCSAHGLLADLDLRPHVDVLKIQVIDWVHTALQDGTINQEIVALLDFCQAEQGIGYQHLEAYMRWSWNFPAATRTKSRLLYQVFCSYRSSDQEKMKCSASELLGLYGLLRHFCETRVHNTPAIRPMLESFFAACKTIDILKLAKYGRIGLADASHQLMDAIKDHMEKHVAVYGVRVLKPKHHWMFDAAMKLRDLPFLLDTLIIERLHLRIKAVADSVLNTVCFERSVLASAITSQWRVLNDNDLNTFGLRGPTAILPGTFAIVSDQLEANGNHISAGDIVFNGEAAGLVKTCACENGSLFVIVECMQLIAVVSAHSAQWQTSDTLDVWLAESVELALAWYTDGDSLVVLRI